jgi:hypothetical protein
VVNELPIAGEVLGIDPLLSRAIDGVKTDILTMMKAHCNRCDPIIIGYDPIMVPAQES